MKKSNILNEVTRIQDLMGVKPIISEQGVMVNLIKNLIKTTASSVDNVFDDAADILVAQGKMTRQEADDAVRSLKSNSDLMSSIRTKYTKTNFDNNVIQLADDLAISRKIDDIVANSGQPSVAKFVEAMKTLPEAQIQKLTQGVISKMFKEGSLPNAQRGYDAVLSFWKSQLENNLRNPDIILNLTDFNNSQIMWAYDYCTRALGRQGTNFTDDMAKEFIDFFDDRFRNEPEIKNLIDQFRRSGRIDETAGVITPPKLREPLDLPQQLSDSGSKKNPFKEYDKRLRDFGKDIQQLSKKYNWFEKFYINVYRPLYRSWIIAFEAQVYKLQSLIKTGDLTPTFNFYTKKFEDAVNTGFGQFVNSGGKANKTYIREIKDKLIKLKNSATPLSPKTGFEMSLKELWELFVKNAESKLTGVELEQFKLFVKSIENQESTYFYSSIDELFNAGAKATGTKTPKDVYASIKETESTIASKMDSVTDSTFDSILKNTLKYRDRLFSLFISGAFRTPKDVERYLVTKGFTGSSTAKYVSGVLFISYVILPTAVGLLEAAYDGFIKSKGLKGDEVYSDNPLLNVLGEYVGPRVLDRMMGKGVISLVTGVGGSDEWLEAALLAHPGLAEDTIYDLITLWGYTNKSDGETEEQMATRIANEKTTDSINKDLEEDYNQAKLKDDRLVNRGLQPVFVNKIADNDLNNISIVKSRIDGLVTSGDITKEDAVFLKNSLKYVPKVPKDFLELVREKQKELIRLGQQGLSELNSLDQLYGKLGSNTNENNIPKSDVGSIVLTSKDGDYLVLIGLTKYPSTTSEVLEIIKDNGEIVWVTPKFSDLNTNTDREYNNLSTFVEKYKK
jgi:polyhydroxyalkanoate synthesis regulator phasin